MQERGNGGIVDQIKEGISSAGYSELSTEGRSDGPAKVTGVNSEGRVITIKTGLTKEEYLKQRREAMQ